MPAPATPQIIVAGDICLDVVGVPMPPQPGDPKAQNWRLTGETRTHYLPGGALLLAEWVRAAVGSLGTVTGPQPIRPDGLGGGQAGPMDTAAFLELAPRLCREEIVHSLLQLDSFPTTPGAKKTEQTLRVHKEAGFSGPATGAPSLQVRYPTPTPPTLLVLDDTGNDFRVPTAANPWPGGIKLSPGTSDAPLIIYKLHRPHPGKLAENPLWDAVEDNRPERRLVIVSVDDLRAAGVPISQGLSWERTAMDVVWQMTNRTSLQPLRECAWLVIRLGLDGAILWRHTAVSKKQPTDQATDPQPPEAWLVYDPKGIEGAFARQVPGRMVGAGSAFTAGMVKELCQAEGLSESTVVAGIKEGLRASQRLFRLGYGTKSEHPEYPTSGLFVSDKDETTFATQGIPIIPEATTSDRGGWRLLDQIFKDKTSLLHRAVVQVASARKPPKEDDPSEDAGVEREAAALLAQVPLGQFGKLRTHDRREMECYRSLHTLLRDYLCASTPGQGSLS